MNQRANFDVKGDLVQKLLSGRVDTHRIDKTFKLPAIKHEFAQPRLELVLTITRTGTCHVKIVDLRLRPSDAFSELL